MSKAGASLATCYGPVSADVIAKAENIRLLILDVDGVSTQQWSYAGESPWYGTAGAALVNKGDKTWLINGEAKPGLRTDAVFELDFTGNNLKWNKLAPVSSPDGVAALNMSTPLLFIRMLFSYS